MSLFKSLFLTTNIALVAATVHAQQLLPPPLQNQPSDVPVAVQILRWHMLDNNVSALAFREMDQLFTTRTVARSGPVWKLPRHDHDLDFSYNWNGKTYYDGVSIRHVMQMRSGVDYEERYDFGNPGIAASNHIAALVKNTARFADVARTLPRIHEPGEFFQYKTIDTAVLGWLIEQAAGMSVAAYTERCLWESLGAEADGYYIMDGPPGVGREFSGAGFNATLRDYARFGQMVLNQGVADGRRIVSQEWIRQSTRPSGGNDDQPGGYGLQWWMVGDDAFAAIGLQGQYVFVDPDSATVVVKLSYFPPGNNAAGAETQASLEAASLWQPQ